MERTPSSHSATPLETDVNTQKGGNDILLVVDGPDLTDPLVNAIFTTPLWGPKAPVAVHGRQALYVPYEPDAAANLSDYLQWLEKRLNDEGFALHAALDASKVPHGPLELRDIDEA